MLHRDSVSLLVCWSKRVLCRLTAVTLQLGGVACLMVRGLGSWGAHEKKISVS